MVVDTLARPPESRSQYQPPTYYAPVHRDHGLTAHHPPPPPPPTLTTSSNPQPIYPGRHDHVPQASTAAPRPSPVMISPHTMPVIAADPNYHPTLLSQRPPPWPSHSLSPPLAHAQPLGAYGAPAVHPETSHSPVSIKHPSSGEITPSLLHSTPAPILLAKPEPRSADPLSISSLVQNDTRTSAQPSASNGGSRLPSHYRMIVRQQPVAARSCGFGERDRRVIDPPPILQVFYEDPDLSEKERKEVLKQRFTIMTCTIWDETGQHDCSNMPDEYRQQRRLMGSSVSAPFVGVDEFNEEGCFYCFPDISCRTNGNFRLKFALVQLNMAKGVTGTRSPVVATAMTDVFTVYTAKDFPGMQASSALTKKLKKQGCLISIKKGNDRGNSGNARDDSDDDDDDDDEGYGGGPTRKKRKA